MVRLVLLFIVIFPGLLCSQVRDSVKYTGQKADSLREYKLEEVAVKGDKSGNVDYVSREQLERVPSILGEKDILKYMATMPGVAVTSALDPGIYVRGGNSLENAFLVNDMEIANPNHLTGIISTFDPYILGSSSIYKSGFPARYNNYLSSYINMFSRPGDKDRASGEISVGLLSSVLRAQSPLGRKKNTSAALSVRASYLQHMAQLYNKTGSGTMPSYSFYDITGSIHSRLSEKWTLSAFGLFTMDKLRLHMNVDKPDALKWRTASANINVKYTGDNSALSWKTGFYGGDANGDIDIQVDASGKNENKNFLTAVEYSRLMGERFQVTAGIKYEHAFFKVGGYYAPEGERTDYDLGRGFLELRYELSEHWKVDGGVNFQYYSGKVVSADWSPRLRLNWNSGRWNVWGDYARTVQYLSQYSLLTLRNPTDIRLPLTEGTSPAFCDQYSCGLSCDIDAGLYFYAALFLKDMRSLKDFSAEIKSGYDILASSLLEGKGQARGVEWDVIYNTSRLYLRANYTLSESWRKFAAINGGNKFHPPYDIKHNVLLNASYKLTRSWTLNALWTYTSGTYTTFPAGVAVAQNIHDEKGEPIFIPVYKDRYNFKLPDNHRLDISADYRTDYKKWTTILNIGVYNVYNQQNAAFVYFEPQRRDKYYTRFVPKSRVLLPCIPYVSLTLIW